MGQIVVIGQFDIHAEDVSAAAELMIVMVNESRKEQGCHHYAYSRDLSNASLFQLSELWESDEALAAHAQAKHTATYRAGMAKLRVENRTVKRYDVTGMREL